MKHTVLKLGGIALIAIGVSSNLFGAFVAPEIDPATGMNAVALVAGALMIIRSRARR